VEQDQQLTHLRKEIVLFKTWSLLLDASRHCTEHWNIGKGNRWHETSRSS
jgi:hypothetical protein